MIRTGIVVRHEHNHPMVCFDRLEMCSKCGQCGANHKEALVRVLGEAEVGSVVSVELPDNKILWLSIIMYFFPLAGLVAGLMIGKQLFQSDLMQLLCALVAMAVFFIVVKLADNHLQTIPKWQPHIVPDEE